MRVTSNGIGINTTNPNCPLCVRFSNNTTTADTNHHQCGLQFRNTDTTDNNWTNIIFQSSGGGSAARIGCQFIDQSEHYGELSFAARNSSGWNSSILKLASDKASFDVNLGLGITTPSYKLTFDTSVGTKICLYDSTGGNIYGMGVSSYQMNYHVPTTTSDHVFYATGDNGDGTEVMRIKGTCNVGIGVSTPSSVLDIKPTGDTREGTHGATALYVSKNTSSNTESIIECRHNNGSQGVGIGFNSINSVGTNDNIDIELNPKGTGKLKASSIIQISEEQSSSPSAPSDGEGGLLYVKSSDGKLYYRSHEVSETSLIKGAVSYSGSKALASVAGSATISIFKYTIPAGNTGGSRLYITLENAANTLIKTEEYMIQFRYAYISSTDKLSSNIVQIAALPTNSDNSSEISVTTGSISTTNTGGGGSDMELTIRYTNTLSGSSIDAVTVNYRLDYYGSTNVSFTSL